MIIGYIVLLAFFKLLLFKKSIECLQVFCSTIVKFFLCTFSVVKTVSFLFYINIAQIFSIAREWKCCSRNAENTDLFQVFK